MGQFGRCICSGSASVLWILLLTVCGGAQAETVSPNLSLTSPISRQVFQRGTDDRAAILVAGQVPGEAEVIEAKADLTPEARRGTPVAWVVIASKQGIAQGRFSGRLTLAAGGWYQLTVRVRQGERVLAEQTVDKVGVGEVFITAGQSNSANFGQPRQEAKDSRVVYFDGTAITRTLTQPDGKTKVMYFPNRSFMHAKDPIPGGCGKSGSPWALLGDRVVASQQVPVCFRSASLTWAEVKNWLPPDTRLYKNLAYIAKDSGTNGVRAVLWHQGESDTLSKTSAETYYERVKTIVETLSKDAGYSIPWFVAQASFHKQSQAPEQQEVAKGQHLLWERKIAFQGPITDDLLGKEYRCDGVHFNQKGLEKHAERWFVALSQAFNWKEYSPGKVDGGNSR